MADNFSLGATTSSYATIRSSTKPRKRKLIVEEKSKIDRELDNSQRRYSNRPSTGVVITKWISTAILGALLLACLTLSKVSVIALSYKMNSNLAVEFPDEPAREVKYMGQLFVMLVIILLVPNVISLIRGLFSGLFREDIPWPTKKGFALASFVSLLESVGTCLFVFKVSDLDKDNPYLLVLVMQTVFLVPVLNYLIDGIQNNRNDKRLVGLFVFAVLLELTGVGFTFYLLFRDASITTMIYTIVAVLCLSVAWSPVVQRNLLKTPKRYTSDDTIYGSSSWDPDQTHVMTVGSSTTYGGTESASRTQSYQSEQFTQSYRMKNIVNEGQSEESRQEIKIMPPTWKLTIFMSSLKIVFTLATSLIYYVFVLFESKDVTRTIEQFGEAWHWGDINHSSNNFELYYFIANMVAGALGYIAGYIACTTCMQKGAFSIPLILSTPLSLVLLTAIKACTFYIPYVPEDSVDGEPEYPTGACNVSTVNDEVVFFIVAASCLCLAQICCYGWVLFKSQSLVLLDEIQLFWTPMYNSVLLEQWLMLVRKNEVIDADYEDPKEKIKKSKIVICTTMYREADYEMRQLLESIQKVNRAQSQGKFETHVFFDGAVKDRKPQEFLLQLVSLVESTLDVKAAKCTKNMTPYGMTLSWMLGEGGMLFVVHLKDNFKVKSKKRWSQVMYMSYVMDYLMNISDDGIGMDTYILTTDADVKFNAESVEALLDLMSRDHSVGAVCARTHPLGSGPLVWYQVFEYAIGHWFQKAAEHVIGSVLCSPGCFSVYRCKALRDILPRYASNVEHAFDFLTMDMGEDRWLCTLMVQSGWRIEYCAAAENSTHCPDEFDEFFKQRRRWVASTLANIMLLLKEWNIVAKLNHRVSFVFLIYQAILLFATLIGPSSVMLIVSGGLVYGLGVDPITSLILQIITTIALTLTCLFCSSKTQLNVCKLISFVYAIVMTATVVGTAVQIIQDPGISESIPLSTTSLYLAGMAGIFVVTGILHLQECIYLLHGIWFLLCLPSGYLVLTVYSICNITDRSWGTREVKSKSIVSRGRSWQDSLQYYFKQIFFCCFKKEVNTAEVAIQTDQPRKRTGSTDQIDGPLNSLDLRNSMATNTRGMSTEPRSMNLSMISEGQENQGGQGGQEGHEGQKGQEVRSDPFVESEDDYEDDEEEQKDVEEWLPAEMKGWAKNFKDAGFDNTRLISGMTEKELKDIGMKKQGLRRKLLEEIKKLSDFEIPAEVPENVETWLKNIGLSQYEQVFNQEQIRTSRDMEILKSFNRSELEKELNIKKPGHIKRFLYAIGKLRNPTGRERKSIEVGKAIEGVQENNLKTVSPEEYQFWDDLRTKCLLPQSTVFGSEEELKNELGFKLMLDLLKAFVVAGFGDEIFIVQGAEHQNVMKPFEMGKLLPILLIVGISRLGDLRNAWLMFFAVSNTLWIMLIETLASQGKLLEAYGSNPVGLIVLVLFSVVVIIQFLAMIVHRVGTLTHFLARAPYKFGESFNASWAFNEKKGKSIDDIEAIESRNRAKQHASIRAIENSKRSKRGHSMKQDKQPSVGYQSLIETGF